MLSAGSTESYWYISNFKVLFSLQVEMLVTATVVFHIWILKFTRCCEQFIGSCFISYFLVQSKLFLGSSLGMNLRVIPWN
jgi:hypothetical protein